MILLWTLWFLPPKNHVVAAFFSNLLDSAGFGFLVAQSLPRLAHTVFYLESLKSLLLLSHQSGQWFQVGFYRLFKGFGDLFNRNNGIDGLRNSQKSLDFKNDYRDLQPIVPTDNDEVENGVVEAKMHFQSLMPYGTRKCSRDYECGRNMECLANICYCNMGFIPESDHCIGKRLQQFHTARARLL